MLSQIINLLYPALCTVCGKKMNQWNQNLCKDCITKISFRKPPFCIKCGKQLNGDLDIVANCFDCKKIELYFDKAQSSCLYDEPIKTLIHNFKYKKITALGAEFSEIMLDFMEKYHIGKNLDFVLPIPMHPKRLFQREINPSLILAKRIAKRLCVEFLDNTLKKIKNTPPQSKLARPKRTKNITGSFAVAKNSLVKGMNILLVDDLFTTGSTVNECAKVLKNGGATYIEAITLARGDQRI